ncbi:MAG: MucB/RseB C-terminal domain-containing protein [Xanthomonadales bacterium]|nr:MucB/RseB C-terminal domain-containing protein [Xanthomonadales bacterium]
MSRRFRRADSRVRRSTRRHLTGLLAAVALAFSLVTSAAAAEEDLASVQSWLDRMAVAVNNLTYRGTLIYVRDARVDALKILRRVDESGMRERLVALNGSPREVLRDNDTVRCIFPDSQSILVDTRIAERLFPAIASDASGLTSGQYSFKFAGTDRIAQMDAKVIVISPRDEFRYGYKLWLEPNTGMLLKSMLQDGTGRPLEQLMFTEIEIGATIRDRDLLPDVPGDGFVQVEMPNATQTTDEPLKSQWSVGKLPAGFQLTSHRYGDQRSMEHMVFTDGLASVSVYVERAGGDGEALTGASRMGAVNMFGHTRDDVSITAVGEVPADTVKMMVNSVRQKAAVSQ